MISNGLPNIAELRETNEVECKLAHGADGRGSLPKDFWPTYSAFANTHGGIVFLGIREGRKGFSIEGVLEPDRIEKDLFNCLNNSQKVSVNVIREDDVIQHNVADGRVVIRINISAANRKQKPVYLKGNPFQGNTYRRLHEGDRPCDDETVRRMLAEQVEDARDDKILPGFSFSDIDVSSFVIYRQILRDAKPNHPWLELNDEELLERLRGIRLDRETQQKGLTVAGLLMFGRSESIQDALPYYFVDYQERQEAKTEARWIDRLVPDGTWSGNIFDFYRRVYRKLTADVKVPFEINLGQRKDDSPVHEAIREALVNTLVHADYTGRVSVLVVKRPDMFGFRNPGKMRISIAQAQRGGESDCRNRILHQMFLMIGAGERAGSGIPKIYSGWKSRSWRPPALYEKEEPEQTLLELRMFDLLPKTVIERLKARFGTAFDELTNLERLILATAATEGFVTHSRLQEITTEHTRDLTLSFQRLIRKKFLESDGKARGTAYTLLGFTPIASEDVFASIPVDILADSEHLANSSEHLANSSEHSANRDKNGCLVSDRLDFPVIDSLEALSESIIKELQERAAEPRNKKRLSREVMQGVILSVSTQHYLTLNALAAVVNRDPDALRQQYLNKMVKQGMMKLAFPTTPKHPMQAYKASAVTP